MLNQKVPGRHWLNDYTLGRLIMAIWDSLAQLVSPAWQQRLSLLWQQRSEWSPAALMTLILVAIIGSFLFFSDNKNVTEETVTDPENEAASVVPPSLKGKVTYPMGPLAGRKAGDLYAAYLGYSGVIVPKEHTIDWQVQLTKLWERKLSRKSVTPVAKQAGGALLEEFKEADSGTMSLASYQKIAGQQAAMICETLDWERVGRIYRLNTRELRLLKRVSCKMGGRVLTAYAMTELLPSADGALNRDYLDFMLRFGGRRYMESLPALHDDITSFGPFQFTQYAVFDTPSERRGASRVNLALPANAQIPGSTLKLRGNEHIKAAYLFAISNLADGIRGLNGKELKVFEEVAGPRGIDVAQYIATAHNKPAVARQSLRRWLDNKAKKAYLESCPRVSQLYARKTRNNYNALSRTIE